MSLSSILVPLQEKLTKTVTHMARKRQRESVSLFVSKRESEWPPWQRGDLNLQSLTGD